MSLQISIEGFSPRIEGVSINLESRDCNVGRHTYPDPIEIDGNHEKKEEFLDLAAQNTLIHHKENGWVLLSITKYEDSSYKSHELKLQPSDVEVLLEIIQRPEEYKNVGLNEEELKTLLTIDPNDKKALYKFFIRYSLRKLAQEKSVLLEV